MSPGVPKWRSIVSKMQSEKLPGNLCKATPDLEGFYPGWVLFVSVNLTRVRVVLEEEPQLRKCLNQTGM